MSKLSCYSLFHFANIQLLFHPAMFMSVKNIISDHIYSSNVCSKSHFLEKINFFRQKIWIFQIIFLFLHTNHTSLVKDRWL